MSLHPDSTYHLYLLLDGADEVYGFDLSKGLLTVGEEVTRGFSRPHLNQNGAPRLVAPRCYVIFERYERRLGHLTGRMRESATKVKVTGKGQSLVLGAGGWKCT